MKGKGLITLCSMLLLIPIAQAGTIRTTVTVLDSLDTEQTYMWFAPGYASTDCDAQATGKASASYGSVTASAEGSTTCQSYVRPPMSGTTTYTGHVLYLRMPDTRVIVAACDKRVNWTEWSGRMFRDCRAPQCTTCDAEISGEKVKLTWSVSLDGSKQKSELYKIQAVLRPQAPETSHVSSTTSLPIAANTPTVPREAASKGELTPPPRIQDEPPSRSPKDSAAEVTSVQLTSENTELRSPMILNIPLDRLRGLSPGQSLVMEDLAKYVCEDVSIELLDVSSQRIDVARSRLRTKVKVYTRPSYDRAVHIVFDLMKGERSILNWVIDNIDAEERRHRTGEQESPSISSEDLDSLLRTKPAPYLRISMTVVKN